MNKAKRAKRAKQKSKEIRLAKKSPERIAEAKSRKLQKKYASSIARYRFTKMAEEADKPEPTVKESVDG
jgi:hypothetical protein